MQLFSRIPDRFFSILSSAKKELYVQALFVLREAFRTELVIRREDLTSMLIDSMEDAISEADFSEEAIEDGDSAGQEGNLSGKAHLLIRRLKETGWIDTEYEVHSFDENITVPDYSVSVINLLFDLSNERVKEYNSYVYATYASLANAAENPDYVYQALQTAYQNTVDLVDELKSLFNNIRRYYRNIPAENNVNLLLQEHFDEYKAKVFDPIYYPLKTIDSVPRFKHSILSILNRWMTDDEVQNRIVEQGMSRHLFGDRETGFEEAFRMINYIADAYEGIEAMLDEIDQKHNEYVNASIEHIRYLMNADRGVKGKLIELLKETGRDEITTAMQDNIKIFRHQYFDQKSLYNKTQRTKRTEGIPLALQEENDHPELVESFLNDIRKQYTNQKIDIYIMQQLGNFDSISTEEFRIHSSEEFILFLLGTIRGGERSADYTVSFRDGNVKTDGYDLPRVVFSKKQKTGMFQRGKR